MSEATVIIKVDDKLKLAFAEAAKAADRTTSQLLRDYMRQFVEETEYESWLTEKVSAARKAVKKGHVQSNEEIEKVFAAKRAKSLQKED